MLSTEHILTLLKLPKVGRNTVASINNSAEFIPANLKELLEIMGYAKKENPRIKLPDIEDLDIAFQAARKEVNKCNELEIKIIGINDNNYPKRLRIIPNFPVLLYAKGNVDCLNTELSVAVVGTREPSEYGKICGKMFGKKFAEKGLVVVSGLAKGIDTLGHQGCIEAGGKTVAVLAQGLDTTVYPKENRSLAETIISTGGCLVSEYGLGVGVRPNYFVERDRIQSGLSGAVAVIETDIKGGTMHTVNYCLEQKKPLGCLNHPEKFLVDNLKANGNQYLINTGKAFPLFNSEDISLFISKMPKVPEDLLPKVVEKDKKNPRRKKDEGESEQITLF